MNTKTVTCYLYADMTYGGYKVYDHEGMDKSFPDQYVMLGRKDVDFETGLTDDDITAKNIAGLREKINQVRALAQQEIVQIENKIQSLLAISHDVADGAA